MSSLNKPLIILGAGGHAAVLVDILRSQGQTILAVVSPQAPSGRPVFDGLAHWPADQQILNYSPNSVELVNGLGSLPGNNVRIRLYDDFSARGYVFASVIASSAIVSPYAKLAGGVQVMPQVVIQAGAEISENCIINTAAVVEHDCKIGKHNHLAPGVILSGGVSTGKHTHIGTGAVITQGVAIGDDVVIAAGAAINKDVPPGAIVYSARPFLKFSK